MYYYYYFLTLAFKPPSTFVNSVRNETQEYNLRVEIVEFLKFTSGDYDGNEFSQTISKHMEYNQMEFPQFYCNFLTDRLFFFFSGLLFLNVCHL